MIVTNQPLYLGIDCGTSGLRACVLAPNGEIEAWEALPWPAEREPSSPQTWVELLSAAVTRLPLRLRQQITAVAIAATSGTILAVAADGTPLPPPLYYDDARAQREAEQIAAHCPEPTLAISPTWGPAKCLWLWQHHCGRVARFLNQADWLTGWLIDRFDHSDYHNALKMGFDIAARRWPEWVTALVAPTSLPAVVAPGTALGLVRHPRHLGLAAEVVVRAGTTDSNAAFIAAGVTAAGVGVTSLGSTLVLKLLSTSPIVSLPYGIYSHWYGSLWLVGGASNAGGRVLRAYFRDDEIAALSARIDPERDSGLDYYPLLTPGERFPIHDPMLPPRLTPRPAEPERFLHGLLEGLARIEALGYQRLQALGATPLTAVVSSGGGAANEVYRRLRQRLLGVPVGVARQQEAAYGAALLARDGTSLFPQ